MGPKITVVVADSFGEDVRRKAKLGPVWIVRSEENQRAVDALRRSGKHDPGHVVMFKPHGDTAEAVALSAIEIIGSQDVGWSECEVIGARPSAALARALHAFGDGTMESTRSGFLFLRTSVP